MAWLERGESLAPVRYRVTIHNYNTPLKLTDAEIQKAYQEWDETLLQMFGDLHGWLLSGAYNVSRVTNHQRPHTNTDIALRIDENPRLLEEMAERAKSYGLFPFRRIRSEVPLIGCWQILPEIKHDVFLLASPKAMTLNRKKNRNYMFCAVNQNGEIVDRNTPQTRIRVYTHYLDGQDESIVSIEDSRKVPPSQLDCTHIPGRGLTSSPKERKSVLSADIRYMLPIHEAELKRLEKLIRYRKINRDRLTKRIEKHKREIQTICQYLTEHPEYLAGKEKL